MKILPTGEVGDEPHYLFKCEFFEKDKKKFIPQFLLELLIDTAMHNILLIEKKAWLRQLNLPKL